MFPVPYRIALVIALEVLAFDAVGQQQVLLAAKRRGQPVHDAQQLLDAFRAGLLENAVPEHTLLSPLGRLLPPDA